MADLIGSGFTVIRNAVRAQKDDTLIPYSKMFARICEILKENGYIENYKDVELEGFKKIKVYLKYDKKRSVLKQIKRVSRPGRRVFVTNDTIPHVLRGFGIAIISTSQGVMTDTQVKEKKIGGELLGMVW
ncbi:MAG: 30S ribosomal protein S8 [Candidatus Omnitrophota bacterium]|nr:30S ribosomal protein S8 [Candidatus Omnitrophota bacterium]